jgi:uncharacterized integral membrane protein
MTEKTTTSLGPWKTGLVVFLLLLVVVFIIQNITSYQVRFLFFQFAVPGAVLVFVAFLLGVVIALITSARRARAHR